MGCIVDIKNIDMRVRAMRKLRHDRDQAVELVRSVRRGRIDEQFPMHFADDMPRSIASNFIDIAARDVAELMAPLPALACASRNMRTAADERRAGDKNKIGQSYWTHSKLPLLNIRFCDALNSYSFGSYLVEPDFEAKMPAIRWESSFNTYYHLDRNGDVKWWAKYKVAYALDLAAQYPAYEEVLRRNRHEGATVEVVTYVDGDWLLVYVPECNNLVLSQVANKLSRPPVVVAERPDQEDVPRGQYDDSVYPELARAEMALFMMKAAQLSVEAPIAVPDDVNDLESGPDAVIRTQNPQGVRRVNLEIPNDVFAFQGTLERQVKEGSRYPDARTGGIQGNIITGRGVQELMGTMDTQIRTMQTVVGLALQQVTSLCFECDEKFFGEQRKTIDGVLTGKPFQLTYTPAQAIAGQYDCKVTYGFAAGLSPSQAIVALLQLRNDNQISRRTAQLQLPIDIDPDDEARQVDVEEMEAGLKQGFLAFLQALGPMVQQGQDPRQILLGAAKALDLRKRGKPIQEAIQEAFAPKESEPEAPGMPGEPGELPPGMRENGLPEGVPYGQAGQPPGGMPTVAAMMSSLRGNGSAVMEAGLSRKTAVGAP